MDRVDIWNIIECFRENGLNTLEADTELNTSRVEAIVTSIFSQYLIVDVFIFHFSGSSRYLEHYRVFP